MPDAQYEEALAAAPPASLVAQARQASFNAILVFRSALADRGAALEAGLRDATHEAPIVNADGTQALFTIVKK